MAVSISLSITQNSQNISNNTSNVTVKVTAKWTGGSYNALGTSTGSITIDGTKYSFKNISYNTSKTTSGSKVVMTKTVDVDHNPDGTKSLKCSASFDSRVSSGTVSCSGSKTLTQIPRKSTLVVSGGELGVARTLTVTRQASGFTHTITAKCGNASITICTKSSNTSLNFTPPIAWASQNTNGTSVTVEYTITTYNGITDTPVGSNTYKTTCSIPASVKPSCEVTVEDAMGYFAKYGAYVRGRSKFKIVVKPTLAYSSPINTYLVTANGASYQTSTVTTDVLKSSGLLEVTARVVDRRKRSSNTVKKSANVLDYSPPGISRLTVGRCDADGAANDNGEYVLVSYAYSASSLNGKNNVTCTLEYKKTSESDYTVASNFDATSNGSYIFAAETGSSYDVLLTVKDDLDTATKVTRVSTAYTIMHWKASGYGMAIGKISELDDVFDVGMQTRMLGGILHPVLEPETDLNDVRTPNTYVGANISNYNYLNCPLTSGTFTLEVVGMGEDGQVKQRLTYCHKTLSKAWERIYYASSWGEWVCVSDFDGQLLWDGESYMAADSAANLSESISKQKSGIVLVFSEYANGAALDQSFHCRFIPKMRVSMHSGKADCIQLSSSNLAYFATKYLYISDTKITGHANNIATGTGTCGITYTNNRFVLRYVIGV